VLLDGLDWEEDFFVSDDDDILKSNIDESERLSRDLSGTPSVTHQSIESYFCAENTVAYKHKLMPKYSAILDALSLHLCEVYNIRWKFDLRRTREK